MTVAFKREAETVLRQGGYQFDRTSGKEHAVWKHPDASRPPIHVPGTPRDPDHALIRLRRAVRQGTTPHIPQGVEAPMAKTAHKPAPTKPLHELLVAHAPPGMQKRVSQIARGITPDPLTAKDLGAWMRKCIQSHGALPNAEVNAAAEKLHLQAYNLSAARSGAGAVSYRMPGGGRQDYLTDFAGRVPEEANVAAGRAKGSKNRGPRNGKVTTIQMPTDPDKDRGRRLDQGDLTEEQRLAAEDQMRRSTELADREAAEIRARLAAGYVNGNEVVPVAEVPNGKKPLTGLEAALELLVQEALAATHALTEQDILMLRGMKDNLARLRSDLDGMAAGISLLLKRVDERSQN